MATIKKPIKVRLQAVLTHTLTAGGVVVENLRQTEAWEGFVKLVDDHGNALVVQLNDANPDINSGAIVPGIIAKGDAPLIARILTPALPKAKLEPGNQDDE